MGASRSGWNNYVLGKMTTVRTEHFVIRFDPAEHEILSLYVPPLLEECWADMTKRYGFSPEVPVLIEVFRKADDFSVRAVGLLDYNRFALGICFGGVLAIDSPQAMGESKRAGKNRTGLPRAAIRVS